MIYKIVELNNKNRKGLHIYIKEKGFKPAYFKLKEGTPIDLYIEMYKQRYMKKRSKKKVGRVSNKSSEQYLKKIKKKLTINQSIKKGVSVATIKNVLQASQLDINKAKMDMLKSLVVDKELLNILTLPENIKKIAHRIEYKISIQNNKGNVLGTTSIFNKVPENVVNTLKQHVIKGEKVDSNATRDIGLRLKSLGFESFNRVSNGHIAKVEMKMIFRKG